MRKYLKNSQKAFFKIIYFLSKNPLKYACLTHDTIAALFVKLTWRNSSKIPPKCTILQHILFLFSRQKSKLPEIRDPYKKRVFSKYADRGSPKKGRSSIRIYTDRAIRNNPNLYHQKLQTPFGISVLF